MSRPSDPDPRREPAADVREAARNLREMYIAMLREGFTPVEAMRILGYMLSGARPPE